MAPPSMKRCYLARVGIMLGAGLVLGVVLPILFYVTAEAEKFNQETEQYCLSCHSDLDLSTTLPSGETLSLFLDQQKLEHSVHSRTGIECEACHTEIKTYPHPEQEYNSKRELSRTYYQACWKCHSTNYEKTLDSMHAQVAEEGNLDAPVCTDCHGAHFVRPPDEPRSLIAATPRFSMSTRRAFTAEPYSRKITRTCRCARIVMVFTIFTILAPPSSVLSPLICAPAAMLISN